MQKAKQTQPHRGRGNNLSGNSLNQEGFGGGSERLSPGSLNQRGFGPKGGSYNSGIVKHGMESKPIPKDEQ